MDIITTSLLNDFVETEEIKNSNECENFEHFCNYTIIANQCNKNFNFDDVSTGGGGDTGIDGIGIIINGTLINDLLGNEIAIDDFLENTNTLDVDFIFIQSKTSSKFKNGDIHNFLHGVEDFLKKAPTLSKNNTLKEFSDLKDKIYANALKFKKNKPNIKVFYITTGTTFDNNNTKSIIDRHEENLRRLNISKSQKTYLLGAEEIAILYRKARTKNSAKFIFTKKIDLPPITGVDQAHYGVLPFKEFKKILFDENEHLLNMFDDNIRDYQGPENSVNAGILKTLESDNPQLFSVLNNGVTIVADEANSFLDEFTITDYQIVNGCQTSNVLFESRDNEALNEIQIPLRLIVTTNSKVRNKIILSTNTQTPTRRAQHSALSPFQKGLELYYNGCLKDARLKKCEIYYERRSKQYSSNIKRSRIITIENQAKSYSAMFRQDAHLVTTYFGKLANQMNEPNSGLCDDDHKYAPYYMAGLAYYKLESFFRSKAIDRDFKKVRFYVLMLVRMIATDQENPHMNSERETTDSATR